jgi:hypothetical protein
MLNYDTFIIQGIVTAIRKIGGRFLEYDEQTRTYYDVGDNKACEKTSQALREGMSKIRQQIYSDLAAGRPQPECELHLLGTSNVPIPAERYFDYSVHYMLSHYNVYPHQSISHLHE